MVIWHKVTLYALSKEARVQRKLRIAVFAGVALVFGLIGWMNNPFKPEDGPYKLWEAIGGIATGYAIQAVCFIAFNVLALLGDNSVRAKDLSPEWSSLAGIDYLAGIFMLVGFLGVVVSTFEQGFHVLGTIATAANIGVWVYILKTTRL